MFSNPFPIPPLLDYVLYRARFFKLHFPSSSKLTSDQDQLIQIRGNTRRGSGKKCLSPSPIFTSGQWLGCFHSSHWYSVPDHRGPRLPSSFRSITSLCTYMQHLSYLYLTPDGLAPNNAHQYLSFFYSLQNDKLLWYFTVKRKSLSFCPPTWCIHAVSPLMWYQWWWIL